MLTGRVSQMLGNARLNEDTGQYEYLGDGFQRGQINQWGFFAQDNWRVRNNLTVNAGLRYELALPFESVNNSYSTATFADVCGISGVGSNGQCNLFMPGTLTGKHPTYVNYSKGTPAFNTDRNNFAPSLGHDLPAVVRAGPAAPAARPGWRHRPLRVLRDVVRAAGHVAVHRRLRRPTPACRSPSTRTRRPPCRDRR